MPRTKKIFTCYYCGEQTDSQGKQYDHFPIPKSAGGKNTVVACNYCHNIKDRWALLDLPDSVMQEICFIIASADYNRQLLRAPEQPPEDWETSTRETRLAWARLSRIAQQEPGSIQRLLNKLE